MNKTIRLAEHGVRLFYAVLEAHDFLWFASYDVSGISSTEIVVHNYALCYALSRFERGVLFEQVPTYETDLAQMPLYATPAEALFMNNPFIGKVKLTWNALDTRTQRTQDPSFIKRNTPMIGRRVMIAPLTRFFFYVFTFDGIQPPGTIRLGKKRSPCRVQYDEIPKPIAFRQDDTFIPSHLINPLDVNGKVEAYNVISIPPHLLLRNARMRDDYVISTKKHKVHLPGRVLARVEVV